MKFSAKRVFISLHGIYLTAVLIFLMSAIGYSSLQAQTVGSVSIESNNRQLETLRPEDYGKWEQPGSGVLSPYGEWPAYSVGISEQERDKLEEQNKPVRNKLGLLILATGEQTEIDEVSSFSFNEEGTFPVMKRYYPANYQPGKKYPMITYVYEMLSQSVRRYVAPSETSYYNINVFTHQGYFELQPDIVFDPGDPGISPVRTMEAAVKKGDRHGAGR